MRVRLLAAYGAAGRTRKPASGGASCPTPPAWYVARVPREIVAALTIDDAPSIAAAAGAVAFDPARLDAVREQLQHAGIAHCVAFVIGAHARGSEARLERWLQAGYELGNHSDDHARASDVDRADFTASLVRCDALLRSVGAFEAGRARYFRFPFGDRGRTPAARRDLVAACTDLGYVIADVSIDLYDHCYEAPLAAALAGQPAHTRAIEARYLTTAERSMRRAARLGRRRFGAGHVHVATCHFGLVTERTLLRLLARLRARVRWSPLAQAVGSPAYARNLGDPERNGILAGQLRSATSERVMRPFARYTHRADWFAQQALGPRWPHLQY